MLEGKVSSKYQLTLPAPVRKALGIKPGDIVRYQLEGGKLTVAVVRPDIGRVLDEFLATYELRPLNEEIGTDAVAHVRAQRGWRDFELDDER